MIIPRQQRKNRGYKQTVGSFSSCKMDTSVWYTSLLQKNFMYWLEFDPEVLSYTAPGIPIDCYINGRHKSYTPDFQVVRQTKKQIVEVKPKKKVESDDYRRWHRILSDFYKETEWALIVVTECEVQQEPLLSNIKLLYRYERENFSANEYRDCLEVVRSKAPASFAEIGQALDDRHIRRNVLFKLLFHSLVEIDIRQAINGASTISAASENIDWRILFNG